MRFEEPEHKKKDDFEEVFIMNEFLKMNINDSILRNEEIFAILKERQPNIAREILQGFRAEKLVEAGMSEDLDSAIKFLKKLRGHRSRLGECQESSDKYVAQLTDLEYHGFMRMSRARFQSMCEDLEQYWKDKGRYQHPASTPVRFQLSKARQVVERAFGIMIKRWRILVKPLEFKTIEQMAKVIRACAVLHNICTKDSLAAKNDNIIIPQTDARRNPFNVKDPKNGVVPKIRMHLDTYRSTGITLEERDRAADTQLNKAGKIKRDAIADILHSNGVMRRQKRGRKRAAAYQISADKG